MTPRSLLFVPADSESKLAKTEQSAADVLILDLEDAVAPARKALARDLAAKHLRATANQRPWQGYVRINPLSSAAALPDLAAIVGPGLDGIVLPKADSAEDLLRLGNYLEALEARAGLAIGATKVIVVATETARAMLNLASYCRHLPRLAGLTWGAEDLSAAVGAVTNREIDGALSHAYLMARSACLVAAAAAEVPAIDTLFTDYRDAAGLERDCRESRRRGFCGRIAIHPDQVDTINRCFSPSAEDIAQAQAVVEAFTAKPDAGTVGIGGKMYDRPHLVQAQRTLASVRSQPT